MTQFCNYIYRDPKDGTVRYVGYGSTLARPLAHLRESHNNRLNNMLRKRAREGFDPQPEVTVCTHQSESYAKLVECCWIEKHGRLDKKTGTLFNGTDGGDGCRGIVPWSKGKTGVYEPATIEKISKGVSAYAATRTDEELAAYAATMSAAQNARSQEAKDASTAKRLKTRSEWSPEQAAAFAARRSEGGRNRSPEANARMGESMSKLVWRNDGTVEMRTAECPEGWETGRLPKALRGLRQDRTDFKERRWWNNGVERRWVKEQPGPEWVRGMVLKGSA